ncbi:caspase family protein [Alphaproteobacteria bacterium]|nr:caspase family protein [Alphaproteobacteria bacterium]
MKKLLVILSFVISVMCISSQSWGLDWRECPSNGLKNRCWGFIILPSGKKVEGIFVNGQFTNNNKILNNDKNSNIPLLKKDKIKRLIGSDLANCPLTGYFDNCYGRLKWKNGSVYEGEWKYDKRNGKGIFNYADGKVDEGMWKDNKFMYAQEIQKTEKKYAEVSKPKIIVKKNKTERVVESDLPDCPITGIKDACYGTEIFQSGNKYVGEYKDNKRHGEGIFTFINGTTEKGTWKKDKLNGYAKITDKYNEREGIMKDNTFLYARKFQKIKKNDAEVNKPNTSSKELDKLKRQAEEEKQKRKELENRLALIEKEQKPTTIIKTEPKSEFPLKPIPINFPSVSIKRDDIAVIIGNANYKKMGKDIPNVNPAYADAEGIKQYFMKAKGIKEGNIIYLKDATGSQLLGVFGNKEDYKGQLYNYIKPNKSNVYVYYAGHGVPSGSKGSAYIVPSDANAQTVTFSGYPLSTLYSNLGKLPAKSVTVILEACFSGSSQAGSLFTKSSPITPTAIAPFIPANVKVIAAGSESQMASWEQDSSHSLFTKYFLKAMSGEGDTNKDGKVSDTELKEYLSDTMTYFARRYYGRDQKVQIHNGG